MIKTRLVASAAVTALALAGAALSGTASGDSSARGGAVEVDIAKKPGGPFQSYVAGNVKEGKSKSFYFSARSNVGNQDAGLYDESPTTDDYRVKWYEGKKVKPKANVTKQVEDGGYQFVVKNKTKYFVADVKFRGGGNGFGFCLVGQVAFESSFDSGFGGLNGNNCAG